MKRLFNEEADSPLVLWLAALEDLSWSPSMAQPSAERALTEAQRLGIPFDYAARHLFEFALEMFFQSNPDLPFCDVPQNGRLPRFRSFETDSIPTRDPVENIK